MTARAPSLILYPPRCFGLSYTYIERENMELHTFVSGRTNALYRRVCLDATKFYFPFDCEFDNRYHVSGARLSPALCFETQRMLNFIACFISPLQWY